jgi:hypothetical protein
MVGDIDTLSRAAHALGPDSAAGQLLPSITANRLMQLAMRLQPSSAAAQQRG